MRDLIRTSALILVFTAGVAAAQQPSSQTSPQSGQSPAGVEEEANKAAKERIESAPSSEGATIEDARGKGNPKSDQVVGPPNAGPVPLRGDGLDLPGASPQTVPSKFSERIAAQDDMAIMARPVNLSDEQRPRSGRPSATSPQPRTTRKEKSLPRPACSCRRMSRRSRFRKE